MEINSKYNASISNEVNNNIQNKHSEKGQQQETALSNTDKSASSAITSMGKSLVSRPFIPAQTIEELQEQVHNTSWYKHAEDINLLPYRNRSLSKEYIIALSEFLHKANELTLKLKQSVDIKYMINECYKDRKLEYLKRIKNFSPALFNKLDPDLQANIKNLTNYIIIKPLENVDEVNKCYRTIKDEYKTELAKDLLFHSSDSEKILKIIEGVNNSHPDIMKLVTLSSVVYSKLPASQVIDVLNYLTKLRNRGEIQISRYDINNLFQENYSYSIANQDNEPVCGTDKFKPFTTKEQLKTELASMRSDTGMFMFSDNDIEHIINNDNDISDLSKILHEIQRNKLGLSSNTINKILKREGVTFNIVKPLIDFYIEINSSDEYKDARKFINCASSDFFELNDKELALFKKNIPFVNILVQKYPEEFGPETIWGGVSLFRIIKTAKMQPAVFEQIVNSDIYPQKLDYAQIESLLRNEDVNVKNIEFIKELKNIPQLRFLFKDQSKQQLNNYDINNILMRKIPENFDLSKKKDIIDFLIQIQIEDFPKNVLGNWNSGSNYIDILLKETDDNVEDGRMIIQFLQDNNLVNCNSYKYLKIHSFSDTLKLLNEFYANPLLNGDYSSIYSYDIDLLDDIVQAAKYANKLNIFRNAKIDSHAILSSYCYGNIKIKPDIKKIESNLDTISKLAEEMSPKLFEFIESELLTEAIKNNGDINIREENISFIDSIINNERFDTYLNFEYINILGLLTKGLNTEALNANKEHFLEFLEKCSNYKKTNIYGNTFITFEGDFSKLSAKLEQIRRHYPESYIEVEHIKDGISVIIDENIELFFDKDLNFVSRNKSHCFTRKDNTTYTGKLFTDKKLNIKNYIVSVDDPVYDTPKTEKLTSKYLSADGGIERTKTYKASPIDGVYDIREVFPNGDIKVLSSARADGENETIEKHLTSPGGVTSDIYYQNIHGNEIYNYIITDASGNILTTLSRTSENIDENTKITSINGKKYKVQYENKRINVYDFSSGETTSIDLTKLNPNEDPVIQDLLRSLSGDELLKTIEFVNKIELIKKIESAIDPYDKTMYVGPHKFIFEHELGHGKDDLIKNENGTILDISRIASDKTLKEIFEREKQLVKETVPQCILDEINYFIADGDEHYGGDIGGLKEVIAETNAIQTTAKFHPLLKMRTQILQEYFPETIAYLLNNHLNS